MHRISTTFCLGSILLAGVAGAAAYQQNFSTTPIGWVLYNDASVPAGSGYLQLNPNADTQRGQAWYDSLQPTQDFTADFQFRIGPSINADGMTFGWVKQIDPSFGESGSALGAYTARYTDRIVHGYDGYFVEIDTFSFVDEPNVPSPHIAICRSYPDVERDQLVYRGVSLQANHWYDMRVKLTMVDATTARVQVWWDSNADGQIDDSVPPLLSYDLTNYQMTCGYFGFTGADAAFTEAHYVDNFRLQVANATRPPVPDVIAVRPHRPTDSDNLVGIARYTDPAKQAGVLFRYQWQRSTDQGATWSKQATGRFLSHTQTQPGELWRLAARAWNGFYVSPWTYSQQVTISLPPPPAPDVVATRPNNPTDETDLVGSASYTNPDNQTGVSFRYRWERSRDGGVTWPVRVTGRFLSHALTQPGDTWRLGARGYNGFHVSPWAYSNLITIPTYAHVLTMTAMALPTPSGVTQVSVDLSGAATVTGTIINLAGIPIARLPEQQLPQGATTLLWDGRTTAGTKPPAGQYLVRLQATSKNGSIADCLVVMRRQG